MPGVWFHLPDLAGSRRRSRRRRGEREEEVKIQLRQRGDGSVYLGKLIDWEERWRGEKGGKLVGVWGGGGRRRCY